MPGGIIMKWTLLFLISFFSFNMLANIPLEEERLSPHSSYNSSNKKFWYWSFFSLASESSKGVTDGYGSIFSYNYFKAKHYLGSASSIALVPTFYISTAGRRTTAGKVKGGTLEIGDLYSEYQYSAYSNTFLNTKLGAKVYFPLSFSSKRSDLKTRGQVYASVSAYPFYKVQTYYKVEANTYTYKGNTYQNKKQETIGKKNSQFYHFLSVSYLTSEAFSVSSSVGQKLAIYEKTPTTEPNRMRYSADMSVSWRMAYKMNISLGLKNEITDDQDWNKLLKLGSSQVIVRTSILF